MCARPQTSALKCVCRPQCTVFISLESQSGFIAIIDDIFNYLCEQKTTPRWAQRITLYIHTHYIHTSVWCKLLPGTQFPTSMRTLSISAALFHIVRRDAHHSPLSLARTHACTAAFSAHLRDNTAQHRKGNHARASRAYNARVLVSLSGRAHRDRRPRSFVKWEQTERVRRGCLAHLQCAHTREISVLYYADDDARVLGETQASLLLPMCGCDDGFLCVM